MTLSQSLLVLVAVILVVWWALRRSADNSAKEAPTGHGHEEPTAHTDEIAHPEPVHFESTGPGPAIDIPPAPIVEAEPTPVAEPAPVDVQQPEPVAVAERAPEPVAVTVVETEVKPEDLVIIEGIGPRISGVLKSNGVKTFAQLAAMQPAEIKAILTAVDERLGRIADPTTWPEQAALAAKGDLEGLQKLQDSLKGGRLA